MDSHHTTDTAIADVPAIGPFYTTSEVARMLHMSQRVVQEWVRTGALRAAHYGAAWRISHADLEAFVAQASAPPRGEVLDQHAPAEEAAP